MMQSWRQGISASLRVGLSPTRHRTLQSSHPWWPACLLPFALPSDISSILGSYHPLIWLHTSMVLLCALWLKDPPQYSLYETNRQNRDFWSELDPSLSPDPVAHIHHSSQPHWLTPPNQNVEILMGSPDWINTEKTLSTMRLHFRPVNKSCKTMTDDRQ